MTSFASVASARLLHAALCTLLLVGVAACGDETSSGTDSVANGTDSTTDPATGSVTAKSFGPTISGSPATIVNAGTNYWFQPTASAAAGATLKFSVQNKPDWAAFDATSGRLTGSPTAAQVGRILGIIIAVTDGTSNAALPAFSITVNAPLSNLIPPILTPVPPGAPIQPSPPGSTGGQPTISGKPATTVAVGTTYSFKPSATGPSGTTLRFSIANKPAWAVFDTTSGALTGAPTAASTGRYSNIVVSVSDGTASAALPAFAVTVTQAPVASSSATLDWTPPTENTDGSALTNLGGYNIFYGTSPTNLTQSVKVTNPGLTVYTVSNLASGTWYFAVASYTTSGVESARTGVVSTTL